MCLLIDGRILEGKKNGLKVFFWHSVTTLVTGKKENTKKKDVAE